MIRFPLYIIAIALGVIMGSISTLYFVDPYGAEAFRATTRINALEALIRGSACLLLCAGIMARFEEKGRE